MSVPDKTHTQFVGEEGIGFNAKKMRQIFQVHKIIDLFTSRRQLFFLKTEFFSTKLVSNLRTKRVTMKIVKL